MKRPKMLGLAALAVALFLYSLTFERSRSETQLRFDSWLSSREGILRDAAARPHSSKSDRPIVPMLTLQIAGPQARASAVLAMGPSSDTGQVLRLLELMREADIFSIAERSDVGETQGSLTIKVQENEHVFQAHFDRSDIEGSVQAKTLLKLFEQYAVPLDAVLRANEKA